MNRRHRLHTALALALATSAAAADPVPFHIPPQPLAAALRAFIDQSDAELLFAAEGVTGRSSAGVEGTFEPAEALRRLLAGSGLAFEVDQGGAFLLTAAQAPDRQEQPQLRVVVTATRTEQLITDLPAAVSVVTEEQIARQQPTQVSDLLRHLEGVDVSHSASLGGSETINIRGVGGSFAGSTSPVLLDGMALESPVASIHVGLKVLALEDLEQIEVVRGPASALYGPSAVGGVVNLISRGWVGAPGAEVRMGTGSHDARLLAAAAGGAWEQFDLRLSARDYRTDGFKAQAEPDPWGGRDLEGRDGSERKLALQGNWHPADGRSLTFAVRDTEIESAWLGGHPHYRLDNEVTSYDLRYRHPLGERVVAKAAIRHLRQEARSQFDEDYYLNDGSLALAETATQVDVSDQLELQGDIRFDSGDLLTLGYTHALGEYSIDDEVLLDDYRDRRVWKSRLNGIYLQDEHPFSDRFTLFAGVRWDQFDWYGDTNNGEATGRDSSASVVSPRVSALYELTPATGLYGAVGTAYVPALNNLKFRSSSRWLDNPGLDPERAISYELGVHHTEGDWLSRASLFHTDYTDKIAAIVVDAGSGQRQYQNLGKTTVDGLELAIEGIQERGWRPYLNYTYTDSVIRDNPSDPSVEGNHLQYVSPHKLNLGVSWNPADDRYLTLAGRYVDGYYTDDANSDSPMFPRIADHFVADLKAGWRLPLGEGGPRLELTAAVNNLLDRSYRETRFEEADGRNYWLELSGRF